MLPFVRQKCYDKDALAQKNNEVATTKRFLIAALSCLAATAAVTTAPAHAQRLTGTTAPTSSDAKAKKQEPLTGFSGITWRASPEQARKILEAKGAKLTKASDYAINTQDLFLVEGLKVADYETDHVVLRFGSDGFYQANVEFYVPLSKDVPKIFNDFRLIITERFGETVAAQPVAGGGGFAAAGPEYLEWIFDRSEKASIRLSYTSSSKPALQYRAPERAEREEARIRSERAKSL